MAARIYSAFSPIHHGEFGDLPVKLIWGLVGLMPSVPFITGLVTWWRPKPRKPAAALEEQLTFAGRD